MKKIALLITSICFINGLNAQSPIGWTFTAKKIDAKTYEVRLTAAIENGWHLYSQHTPDGGPAATEIEFVKNPLLLLDGTAKEAGDMEEHFEPLFGVQVKQFSNRVSFVQLVKLKVAVKTNISGSINFMTCNDVQCIPTKKQKFSIKLD